MSVFNEINGFFRAPPLTRGRIILALIVAAAADGLQIPFQVVPAAPELIDVIAMILTTFILGFHILLLPTFVLELFPLVDMMPTWVGCVLAVIALRRGTTTPSSSPVIEVNASPAVPVGEPKLIEPPAEGDLPPKIPPAKGA